MFKDSEKKTLLAIARQAIKNYLEAKKITALEDEKIKVKGLKEQCGAFVSIYMKDDSLRGCIGQLESNLPLYETVSQMAVAAAFEDPRFCPLELEELDNISIEISVLSPLKKISSHNDVILGKHGILVKKGIRSGVFLPQVATETGWSKEKLLCELCAEKACLPAEAWKDSDTELYVFTAEAFGEND